MTESTDRPSDSPAAHEVVASASHHGITVRKVATMHGPEAAAVYLSIESSRDDQCTVRIADAIPEPLRGNEVEFHPKYDPENWRMSDGTVVYAARVSASAKRTTVYGIVVDDSRQLELFSAEPAVEVTDPGPDGSSSDVTADGGAFSFGAADETATGADEAASDPDEGEQRQDVPPEQAAGPADGSGPIESVVSEVRRRDLTDPEAQAIRKALGLEGLDTIYDRLDSLREAVDALRDDVAAADRQAADVDRIESQIEELSSELDSRYSSLAEDLEDVEAALDREVRWRNQLAESFENDPDRE